VVGAGGELAGQEGREGGGVKMWKDESWPARRWRRGLRLIFGGINDVDLAGGLNDGVSKISI